MYKIQKASALLVVLVFLLAVFYLSFPLFQYNDADVGRYMGAAWASFVHYNWLWPKTPFGQLYLEKGPVIFWLYQLAWLVSKHKYFSILCVQFLLYVGVSWSAALVGSELFNVSSSKQKSYRYLTFIFVAFSFLMLDKLFIYKFDKLLSLFVLLTFYLLMKLRSNQYYLLILLPVAMVGPLVKGAAYLIYVIPFLIYLGCQSSLGGWIFRIKLVVIFLCSILLPIFYVHFVMINASQSNYLVHKQIAQRVSLFSHIGRHFFYVTKGVLLMMPWILLPTVVQAIISDVRKGCSAMICKWLSIIWLPALIFFILVSDVAIRYFMPIYLLFLVYMAAVTIQQSEGGRAKYDNYVLIFLFIGMVVLLITGLFNQALRNLLVDGDPYVILFFIISVIALLSTFFIYYLKIPVKFTEFVLLASLFSLGIQLYTRNLDKIKKPNTGYRQAAAVIKKYKHRHPHGEVILVGEDDQVVANWLYFLSEHPDYFHSITDRASQVMMKNNSMSALLLTINSASLSHCPNKVFSIILGGSIHKTVKFCQLGSDISNASL